MSPVQVSVDAEHLAEDGLANLDEVLGEPTALADPIHLTGIRELRQRRCGDRRVVGVRDAIRVSREDVRVVNLPGDPSLHQRNVLICWQLNRFPFIVEPCERVVSILVNNWP